MQLVGAIHQAFKEDTVVDPVHVANFMTHEEINNSKQCLKKMKNTLVYQRIKTQKLSTSKTAIDLHGVTISKLGRVGGY